jgi:hypothetical protein
VCASGDWVPLKDVLSQFPAKPKTQSDSVRANPQLDKAELAKHPWVMELLASRGNEHVGPPLPPRAIPVNAQPAAGEVADLIDAHAVVADPIDADAVFAELAAKRQEWADALESDEFFQVRIIGGASSLKRLGNAVEAFQGKATTQPAELFCKQYGLPMSAQYSIKLFGNDVSVTLATEWCQRMSFFWTHATFDDSGDFRFTANCADDYVESTSFTALAAQTDNELPLKARVNQMRSLLPKISLTDK